MTDTPNHIHKAILAVMREIGAIGKDSKNEQQHYNYRSVEAVYNRVQPLFAKHGIYSYPRVIDQQRETGKTKSGGAMHYAVLTIEYTFSADDGSSISVTVIGEGMDSGDKASNKAMTAGHKAAICQVLNIPYQVVDPDSNTPEWAAKLDGRVTVSQINDLKKAWAKSKADEIKDMDRAGKAVAFGDWVQRTVGTEFDVADFRQWRAEGIEACIEALSEKG